MSAFRRILASKNLIRNALIVNVLIILIIVYKQQRFEIRIVDTHDEGPPIQPPPAEIVVDHKHAPTKTDSGEDVVPAEPPPPPVKPVIVTTQPAPPAPQTKHRYDYSSRYSSLNKCKINYNSETSAPAQSFVQKYGIYAPDTHQYESAAPNKTHELRMVRGFCVYFPYAKAQEFAYELRWLYRSWLEMQKYEPTKWRTDLIVFMDNPNDEVSKNADYFLNKMNCSFSHRRRSREDLPMCILFAYKPLNDRKIPDLEPAAVSPADLYEQILGKVDIFSDDEKNLRPFYWAIQKKLSHYNYVDSILIAFDAYAQLKDQYDFLVRSDMDVFLTPFFGYWLPLHCNDFYVGGAGYSDTFNTNRLRRVAANLGFGFNNATNLGSTWYSTPEQFRLVAYLTLFAKMYLSEEEFSSPERQSKMGTLNWPEWHYGVLLLYGQALALNHLIETKQLNVISMRNHFDYPTGNNDSIFKMLHLHVYHGEGFFSKFMFRMGKYDHMENPKEYGTVSLYALKMAIEGNKLNFTQLLEQLQVQMSRKQ